MWVAPKHWRWVYDENRIGALQMAIDEALTENPYPTFRWYGWEKPTLSLGYHQKVDELDWDRINKYGIDVCRRPTGGRAVFHQNVATYSMVVPLSKNGEPTLWEFYQWVGQLWFQTLMQYNSNVQFHQEPISRPGARFQSCFVSGNKYEIVIQNKKIIGSAQRRYFNAVLQHGSIRLDKPDVSTQYFFKLVSNDEPIEEEVATSLFEEWKMRITPLDLYQKLKENFLLNGFEISETSLDEETLHLAKMNQNKFTIVRN